MCGGVEAPCASMLLLVLLMGSFVNWLSKLYLSNCFLPLRLPPTNRTLFITSGMQWIGWLYNVRWLCQCFMNPYLLTIICKKIIFNLGCAVTDFPMLSAYPSLALPYLVISIKTICCGFPCGSIKKEHSSSPIENPTLGSIEFNNVVLSWRSSPCDFLWLEEA